MAPISQSWQGVFPALTTTFKSDLALDCSAMEKHFSRQLASGVHGFVVLGSLGENGSLGREEKLEVLRTAVSVSAGRVPVLTGVAESTTAEACRFATDAQGNGASGLMVLPPVRYQSDRRETLEYFRTVASSTDLPIMIYNNPVAYRVDITPDMLLDLADEPKFVAVKESSENIRRVTDIVNLIGDRYRIFAGVDDLALESLTLGAVGWVAGLVNAFPRETVALYNLACSGNRDALRLYRWFMPLLHLDVSIKFVQYIKLAEAMTGEGTETVRPPRLQLVGEERDRIMSIVSLALKTRPVV